jgi:hypothetical protein
MTPDDGPAKRKPLEPDDPALDENHDESRRNPLDEDAADEEE